MDDDYSELARLNDQDQIYEVQRALVARGIAAEVWEESPRLRRRTKTRSRLRLMVPERRLVYARWIAHAAGLDTWPDETNRSDDEAAGEAA